MLEDPDLHNGRTDSRHVATSVLNRSGNWFLQGFFSAADMTLLIGVTLLKMFCLFCKWVAHVWPGYV